MRRRSEDVSSPEPLSERRRVGAKRLEVAREIGDAQLGGRHGSIEARRASHTDETLVGTR